MSLFIPDIYQHSLCKISKEKLLKCKRDSTHQIVCCIKSSTKQFFTKMFQMKPIIDKKPTFLMKSNRVKYIHLTL